MADYPVAFLRSAGPSLATLNDTPWMVFRNVVEVVRDGPPDVNFTIVFQLLNNRKNRPRVVDQRRQFLAPWQTRPDALTTPTPNVRIRV